MFTQVVVLSYQSPETDSFTYEIPKNLEGKIKIGQVISVPFGKRNPFGIVLSVNNNLPTTIKNIKPVISIILEKPILLPYQIKLLKWLSGYYIAPMINCLKALLPQFPKKLDNQQLTTNNQQLTQTLILVPSLNHIPQVMSQFPQAKNYAVYTNELKTSEKFNVWQKILSGQVDFIFGSRSAIFSPCPNLKKIIIFDEHDGAFKDDRSPYFATLTVAEKISELTGAQIEIIDSSPKISTYFNSIRHSERAEESRSFSLRLQDDGEREVQTKTISLSRDRKLGNYSSISTDLEEIIKRAYSKKLSVLLFLNKKIESGSIFCKDCKHREFFKSQPEVCPNCQSAEIYFNSTNINTLAREVKKILPGAETNFIAEKTTNTRHQIPDTKITIATSAVFYKLHASKFDLVAHIYADSPLNFNQYNSQEEIYSQITNLKKLTKKLLIIQTYNEELPAIKFAVLENYEAFYKSELAPRKLLNYPPFSLLVKITVSGRKETDTEKKAQKLYRDLTNQLPVTILGPFAINLQRTLSYNIILKNPLTSYSLNSRQAALNKIKNLIPTEKDLKIIVEPKNLN